MPKCFKCEKVLQGGLVVTNLTEKTADLGVKAFYFSNSGFNTCISFACELCHKVASLEIDFVKRAVAGSDFSKNLESEKKLNEALTTENASLKAQLDTKSQELETLKAQSVQREIDLAAVRVQLEESTKTKNTLTDQIAQHLVRIKVLEVNLAQKEKEMTDLKAKDIERAKQHASVKIGLKFETYDQTCKLLGEWGTKLTDFKAESTLQEVHDRLQKSFQEKSDGELEHLRKKIKESLIFELDQLTKTCEAHEKMVEAHKEIIKAQGLQFTDADVLGPTTLYQSILTRYQNRLKSLEEYSEALENQPDVNEPLPPLANPE